MIDLFETPEDDDINPFKYFERCIKFQEHEHIREGEPRFAFLYRCEPLLKADKRVLGAVHVPGVQGQLRDVFGWLVERAVGYTPDFLVILDKEYWEGADDRGREILMHHELCHVAQRFDKWGAPMIDMETGKIKFKLRAHDVEEFTDVVRRYGAWNSEIESFVAAVGGCGVVSD